MLYVLCSDRIIKRKQLPRTNLYLEETVERGQYDGHGQILRVDEVEGLGHCNEHLVVYTVRNPLLLHPLGDRERITLFNVLLAEQNSWQEPDAELDLFRTSEQGGTGARRKKGVRKEIEADRRTAERDEIPEQSN